MVGDNSIILAVRCFWFIELWFVLQAVQLARQLLQEEEDEKEDEDMEEAGSS